MFKINNYIISNDERIIEYVKRRYPIHTREIEYIGLGFYEVNLIAPFSDIESYKLTISIDPNGLMKIEGVSSVDK